MARWKKGQYASERLDRKDLIELAYEWLPYRRCICGRLTHEYLVPCTHCGDTTGRSWDG